jgi:hypothetical protein
MFRGTCSPVAWGGPAVLIDLLGQLTCYILSYHVTKTGIITQFRDRVIIASCIGSTFISRSMSSPPGTLFARQWRASAFA